MVKRWEDTDLFRKIADGPMARARERLINGAVWLTENLSYSLVKMGFGDLTVLGDLTAAKIVEHAEHYKKEKAEYHQDVRGRMKMHTESSVVQDPQEPKDIRSQVLKIISFNDNTSQAVTPDFEIEQQDERHVTWTRKPDIK